MYIDPINTQLQNQVKIQRKQIGKKINFINIKLKSFYELIAETLKYQYLKTYELIYILWKEIQLNLIFYYVYYLEASKEECANFENC